MDRRTFIGAAASVLIATPLATRAQQKDKAHYIGFLMLGEPPTPAETQRTWALARELG